MTKTKELVAAVLFGVMLSGGVYVGAKAWYLVKVVRTADRVLRGVMPPPPPGHTIPIEW